MAPWQDSRSEKRAGGFRLSLDVSGAIGVGVLCVAAGDRSVSLVAEVVLHRAKRRDICLLEIRGGQTRVLLSETENRTPHAQRRLDVALRRTWYRIVIIIRVDLVHPYVIFE